MSDILTGTPPGLTYEHEMVREAWAVVWAIASGALVVILGWMGLSLIVGEHLGRQQATLRTHWEPPSIYHLLQWLEGQLAFPLYVVDNSLPRARHGGRSLREDVKALTNHSGSPSYVDIPVYLRGHDGESDGIGRRQCATNYMVRPVRRRIRELLRLWRGQRVPSATSVELWLGISTDEAIRMSSLSRPGDN